ncbi:N-formylglutamate amidohydrolase [Pacificibacter marinus]|uniref:N-formylglutamate amidohydrolase n=1 Tax=Pacificibacter marinus TaxID=658057 RepID=UPI003F53D5FE
MTAQDDGKMNDFSPFQQITEQRTGRWLITCDHATNRIPSEIQVDLGLPHADLSRHIAYDIGAQGFTLELARLLNSPAILSDFSRLVIDPNRGEIDPTLVMQLYDGTIIPANRHIDAAEIARRLDTYYRPYHNAYEALASKREDVAICAIHSFTPQLKARPRRPWQIGILSHYDKRLTAPLIKALETSKTLQAEAEKLGERLTIGDNEPYIGHFPGDAIDTHAIKHGRLNVLIELRSDLIETTDDQRRWAGLLAPILAQTLKDTGL